MYEEYGDVMTVDEVSHLLKISKYTVVNQILKKNVIPYCRIGKMYRIQKVDIINYLRNPKGEV